MIDLTNEQVLSLTDAAKILPRRRAGKRPHVATLYRWASRGLRGVKLETIQVGGTLCTSREAVQRFCEQLSESDATPSPTPSSTRKRAMQAALTKLKSAGL